jgi:hypothetical protein
MIKIKNGSRYDEDVYLINPDNISYITILHQDSDGYVNTKTHVLIIHFISSEMNLELKTYDMDTFNKWLELFGVKSNE